MDPILKWAGGKRQLLPTIESLLPSVLGERGYAEPFVGGGAVYFHLQPRRAVISDSNGDLVRFYRAIRSEVGAVIRELRELATDCSEIAYYRARERFNHDPRLSRALFAALFLYLNRLCFNGLYRVNKKGEFNVPAGKYKNPIVLNERALRDASAMLKQSMIEHGDFEDILSRGYLREGDFVYFDPPYVPLSDSANFTSYTADGFGPEDQERLSKFLGWLDRNGILWMLSNHDTPETRKLYAGWHLTGVQARRAINSEATKRGAVGEIVVRNYGGKHGPG